MCESKAVKCCRCEGGTTCDCAEERKRLAALAAGKKPKEIVVPKEQSVYRGAGVPSVKRTILTLAALTALFGGLLFRSLDRKTQHRLLSMIGLGFLISMKERNPYCDPCPQLNPAALRFPRTKPMPDIKKTNAK